MVILAIVKHYFRFFSLFHSEFFPYTTFILPCITLYYRYITLYYLYYSYITYITRILLILLILLVIYIPSYAAEGSWRPLGSYARFEQFLTTL